MFTNNIIWMYNSSQLKIKNTEIDGNIQSLLENHIKYRLLRQYGNCLSQEAQLL